jgi:hypothetical protein
VTTRSQGLLAASSASAAGVPSLDPSLTKTTSKAPIAAQAASMSASRGPTLPTSLRTGTTTLSSGEKEEGSVNGASSGKMARNLRQRGGQGKKLSGAALPRRPQGRA